MQRRSGFTLLELIVALAIVGVLAAVAAAALGSYIDRAKAAEAATILLDIREKQERYFDIYKCYTDHIPWTPYDCDGDTCPPGYETIPWPGGTGFQQLGVVPDGPVWFTYKVDSAYQGCVFVNNHPADGNGTTWPATQRPWFTAEACGDMDVDGICKHFYISSANRSVYSPDDGKF
ncbi:MAG: prepilin-type N-terminal cleavage/methylation domain-containing protein [Deltaproteobacteria bacterium]|nr:prepilin-type N-terminal cleavage/methylation domain-containing protein [Deltaproteobacteria bacterium]